MVPERETLTIEFKSDRKCLPDEDLVEAVVSMANSHGGVVYVGVEDDGTPTGLHPRHASAVSLAAMIANKTTPPLSVRVEQSLIGSVRVVAVHVPMMREVVTTRSRCCAHGAGPAWGRSPRPSRSRRPLPRRRSRFLGRRGWCAQAAPGGMCPWKRHPKGSV